MTFNDWNDEYHDKGIEWIEAEVMVANLALDNARKCEIHYATCNENEPYEPWVWKLDTITTNSH